MSARTLGNARQATASRTSSQKGHGVVEAADEAGAEVEAVTAVQDLVRDLQVRIILMRFTVVTAEVVMPVVEVIFTKN